MVNNFKNLKVVIALTFICIFLCILTFLAFINPKLLFSLGIDLQILLILDLILFTIFFLIIFKKIFNLYSENKKKKDWV